MKPLYLALALVMSLSTSPASAAVQDAGRTRAAEAGDVESLFVLAQAAEREARFDEAIRWYRAAAERGHLESMFLLSQVLGRQAKDVDELREGERWQLRAAEAGHLPAILRLADGLDRDDRRRREAFEWRLRAAERGDPPSAYLVAGKYRRGEGVPCNDDEARRWLRVAIAAGAPYALIDEAEMAAAGRGGPVDRLRARALYELLVARGDTTAMVGLAGMLRRGLGGSTDPARAYRLYRSAADDGNVVAALQAGLMTEFGLGIPKDASLAVHWYRMAGDNGRVEDDERVDEPEAAATAEALVRLGALVAIGRGTDRDSALARALFERSGTIEGSLLAGATLDVDPSSAPAALKAYDSAYYRMRRLDESRWEFLDPEMNGGSPEHLARLRTLAAAGEDDARFDLGLCAVLGGIEAKEGEVRAREAAARGHLFSCVLLGYGDQGRGFKADSARAIAAYRQAVAIVRKTRLQAPEPWSPRRFEATLAYVRSDFKDLAMSIFEHSLPADVDVTAIRTVDEALAAVRQSASLSVRVLADKDRAPKVAEARVAAAFFEKRAVRAASAAESMRWLRMAAMLGEDYAMMELAWRYELGETGPADRAAAYVWYAVAQAQGDVERLTERLSPQQRRDAQRQAADVWRLLPR